ncbi:hypothetical protein EDB81DRAFT_628075, partial [Dactylonectria macrodidyma]
YKHRSREVLVALARMPDYRSRIQGHLLGRRGRDNPEEDLVSPPEDEQKLTTMLGLVDKLLDRCEETTRKTSRNILCWLRSTRSGASYPKPFTLVRHPASTKKYRWFWKRALLFVFRAHRLDSAVREKMTGIRLKRKLTALLEEAWDHPFWMTDEEENDDIEEEDDDSEYDDEDCEGENEGEGEDEGEDEDENIHNYKPEDSGEREDGRGLCDGVQPKEKGEKHEDDKQAGTDSTEELVEILFGLSLALCTEHLIDGQPNSTVLVYFSGVLGFSKTSNRFLPARSYTTFLSGLIYIQRLLFLERALPFRSYPTLGIDHRPRTKQLDRLKKIRERYMVVGSQSAFEEFISLRSYGRVMARSDTPPILLRWSEDG